MSPRRRIVLNILVTYGRSLYGTALGLFTARWALHALGQTDYGLLGLVGGLVTMVSFLNSILASSVGRFYAVSVGEAKRAGNEVGGLTLCQQWFNTALSIHALLPILLIMIGYPVGVWAVRCFLSIPAARVSDCVWVWRFCSITCFLCMISVPFRAMYTAKQEIAELTVFSFITTTANAAFLYYMVTHPRIWLARYSLGSCIIIGLPEIALIVRAVMIYKECKIIPCYWFDFSKYRQLGKFAIARFWAGFAALFSNQGHALLVNKYMGPHYNASMSISNSVASHAMTLSSSLSGAFYPAIANLCGEGRMEEMRRLCFMTCRFGAVLFLVFAVPLTIEMREVLNLWLGAPPPFAVEICMFIIVQSILERMTEGYWMGIYGNGKGVAKYSWTVGWSGILAVCIAFGCFFCGMGMWSVVIGLSFSKILTVIVRLLCGKAFVGLEMTSWLWRVFTPVLIVSIAATCAGLLMTVVMTPSVVRVILTGCVCNLIMLPLVWFLVFERQERAFLLDKIERFLSRSKS